MKLENMGIPMRWLIMLILLIILIWGASGFILYDLEDRGTIGDMFGAVNALFSGLAFAGVVYAILLQRKDLELQRRELELTREELEGQKMQLAAQNETMKVQNFENTFFQLLRLHHDIINAIDLIVKRSTGEMKRGRDCFEVFWKNLAHFYMQKRINPDYNEENVINVAYQDFYSTRQSDLGHYFRNLYNIIKFVKNAPIDNKRFYTNLLRAQLSSYELVLLFYNCLSAFGRAKFKPLIEEFGILEQLPKDKLLLPEHLQLYGGNAYGEQEQ